MGYISEDYCSEELSGMLMERGYIGATNTYLGKDDINIKQITIQSAMKWLRERHDIHPNIVVEVFGPYALYKIDRIFDGNEEKWVDFKNDENISGLYNTYEEACEADIKYCLENLI